MAPCHPSVCPGCCPCTAVSSTGTSWALKFLDATGKFPSGVLTALSPSSDPGSYDECLSIGDRESAGMAGRYCTVLWVASAASLVSKLSGSDGSWNDTFQNSVKRIRQGVCVPSHCSGSELEALIEKVFNGSSTTATVSACRSRNDLTLTHTQLAIVCIFIVWITLVAFSTLLHFYWDRKETSSKETADSCLRRLTVALSAVTSIKRLLLVSQEKHMAAVQPLKAISLLWIILGMTYRSRLLEHTMVDSAMCLSKCSNESRWRCAGEHELDNEWGSDILYTLAASSDLAYTTVLLISGYCAANTVLELHRLKVSYVRRLIAVICLKNRLTVSAVLTLGAFLLYPLFVDGPGADRVLPRLSAVCQRRWGFVLVHLNNLRGHENVVAPLGRPPLLAFGAVGSSIGAQCETQLRKPVYGRQVTNNPAVIRLVHDVLGCRTVAALGRLSLGAYLCSWMIAMHGVLSARHTLEAGQAFVVRDFVANTMLSYVAALLFYVACDGPAQSLCSLLRTLVIGREAARRRRSFDECDRKVRFLSELLGLEAPRSAKELPHQQYTSRTLQRISSLKDMVLHL
ncbi:hypothetical protein V5799_017986 [Amblyomma americanum]|uniref:Nose resistant-to-fluoxetine protein N-terminal domain-containing protein n=1 Tax=Amblyomma americanum TaxID=6943 RepID=A0AAQ4F1N3_AMBAM